MILLLIIIVLLALFPVATAVVGGVLVQHSGGLIGGGGASRPTHSTEMVLEGPPPTALQRRVAADYPKFKVKTLPSFDDFCFPTRFVVQKQQQFLGEYLKPGSPTKEMLVFHGIGSGKSCVAIQIAQQFAGRAPRTGGDCAVDEGPGCSAEDDGRPWVSKGGRKARGRPLILLPASLIPGMYAEFRSACGSGLVTDSERQVLSAGPSTAAYAPCVAAIRARIDASYNIMSYNRFQTSWKSQEAPCLIVDEVQNINNSTGAYYKAILKWIDRHPRATIVLMSGTPLFDNVTELPSLARLLRVDVPKDVQCTVADVPRWFAGKVSYFRGAPPYVFPKVTLKVKRLAMSRFQAKWYVSNVVAEESKKGIALVPTADNFYCKSRQVANVAMPNGLMGSAGLAQLTAALIREHLDVYSCKMAHLVRKLQRGGLAFVYSAFAGPGGIQTITKVLRAFGWKDYAESGPGPRRYAVWSGEQSQADKDAIRTEFNGAANDHGGRIQAVIGSPAIKEGVSLARVRRVIVMEFYWNHSRMAQIYGRASRFCSHKGLDEEDRTVHIIVYAAVNPGHSSKKESLGTGATAHSPRYSVDLYMKDLADIKRAHNEPFVLALQQCAVDRLLFMKANVVE